MTRTRRLVITAALALAVIGASFAQSAHTRGALGGPKAASDVLEAGEWIRYDVILTGREKAKVVVIADGDADLYVYDSRNRLVARDTALDHCPTVAFSVKRTAAYAIYVRNEELRPVEFVLTTN